MNVNKFFVELNREHEMNAKLIVQMDGKKTRLVKPENPAVDISNINANTNRDNFHDFTFDFSYWSFRDHVNDDQGGSQHIVSQDEVYNDLGIDVINCAFQGTKLMNFFENTQQFIHSRFYVSVFLSQLELYRSMIKCIFTPFI